MCQCLPLNNSCWCRGLRQSFGIIAQLRINQGWTTTVTCHWSGQSNKHPVFQPSEERKLLLLLLGKISKVVASAGQDIQSCCQCWARYQKLLPLLGKISKVVAAAGQDIKSCCQGWARHQKLLSVLGKISKVGATAGQGIKSCCHCWARYQKFLPVLGKISRVVASAGQDIQSCC